MLIYQVKKVIGGYAAGMGGIDALVFTGGIGENDASIRAAICSDLEFMGLTIDEKANNTRSEARISITGAKVDVWVIPTNEEILIARDTVELSGLK